MMNRDIYKEAVNDIKADERLLKELAIKMMEKPRKRNMGKYALVAASLAVLIVAAIFVNNAGLFSGEKIAQLNAGDSITLPKGKGTVYINKIEGMTTSKLLIPEGSVSKDYDMEQLAEFFGRNPLPAVPDGYKSLTDTTNITFDPAGKLLFMVPISYSKDINNPDAPSIDIRLNKNELPKKDCLYGGDIKESVIGNTKVVIGALSMQDKFNTAGKPAETYDVYTAEFIYNEVGYDITAKRVDGETFINLLNSIILNPGK